MDATLLLLAFMAVTAFVLFLNLKKKTKQLTKANEEIKIKDEKIMLYGEFTRNSPVKRFFRIIGTVSPEIFNPNIKFMLVKYFGKVFINLDASMMAMLITDVKTANNSIFLNQFFIIAVENDTLNLLGEALFISIRDYNINNQNDIINDFLEELSPETKKAQIIVAIESMTQYLSRELGDQLSYEYRQDMEQELLSLQKRIE